MCGGPALATIAAASTSQESVFLFGAFVRMRFLTRPPIVTNKRATISMFSERLETILHSLLPLSLNLALAPKLAFSAFRNQFAAAPSLRKGRTSSPAKSQARQGITEKKR